MLVDFGATHAFEMATQKVNFHHNIKVPSSASRRIFLKHGEQSQIFMQHVELPEVQSEQILSETDGCMVPIIEYKKGPKCLNQNFDKRKHKKSVYQEAKLSLAQKVDAGTMQPIIFQGSISPAEEIKPQLQRVLDMAGYAKDKTDVHVVGDGAKWIFKNYKSITGKVDGYLIDLYHLGEYLYPATQAYAKQFAGIPNHPSCDEIYKQFKEMIIANKVMLVVQQLKPFMEAKNNWERPIRKFIEYVEARPWQFQYQQAIQKGLPIGSGLIESSNKTVVQKRLKLPGAWWITENANKVLSLKSMELSGANDDYWHAYKDSKYL